MKLHEAIAIILKESNKPLSVDEIVLQLNTKNYYTRNDERQLDKNQIIARIRNYTHLFENINGIIILTENKNWKSIITSYWYLKEMLRGIFSDAEVQFIIASLFFYRRLIDINHKSGRNYPIDLEPISSSQLKQLIDGGINWIKSLKEIEDLYISPKDIFTDLSKELLKIDSFKRESIRKIISDIDTSSFSDYEFGTIYEYILSLNSKEYFGFENSTPESIKELLPKLLNLNNGDSVYDPVAGVGGLLGRLYNKKENIQIKGSEINKRIAQLANMNLMMHGAIDNSIILPEDCFEEINNSSEYDYIIGDLPINGITNSFEHYVLYHQFGIEPTKSEKSFNSLILFSYYKLSYRGKAILTVSDSFLTKGSKEKNIRKILLENDVVEAVISLPKGTYRPYTEAKSSILILNKSKPQHLINKVKFIKVNNLEDSKKQILLNDEIIVNEFHNVISNPKFTQVIDKDDIDIDLNLSAENYDIRFSLGNQMLKNGIGKLLKDIARIVTGKQPTKEIISKTQGLAVIKIENLSKDILDINLNINISNIDKVINYDKYKNSIINQECILIAKIGDYLKPTIFRPTDLLSKVLIHSGVLALIPLEEGNVDLEYLYYQLNSPFTEEQIKPKKQGSLIPFLNKKTVEDIIIPFENIDIQRKFINTQRANLIAEESKRFEQKKKDLGYEEEIKESELNIVRTITHQLKHSLTGIDTMVKKIDEIILNNKIESLKEYLENDSRLIVEEGFEEPENLTISEVINQVLKKSTSLNEILNDVEKAVNLNLEYSSTNILKIFENLKNEYQNKDFEIIISEEKVIAEVSDSHISDMLKTIIKNAEQHSFINIKNPKITFSLKEYLMDNKFIIEYRNNGLPLKITGEEFKAIATKSVSSTGTGVGGYYINKIVEAHKGVLKINDKLKTGIHFTIELPLKQIYNE